MLTGVSGARGDDPASTNRSAPADYISNGDLKHGWIHWDGDGEIAYLTRDGFEGAEGDKDVTPVIKVILQGHSQQVYQTYDIRDNPGSLHIRFAVFASTDFKRSPYASDYSGYLKGVTEDFSGSQDVPNSDFWIRNDPPPSFFITRKLTPGAWTAIDYVWHPYISTDSRVINFCTPPGKETIYIKFPSVTNGAIKSLQQPDGSLVADPGKPLSQGKAATASSTWSEGPAFAPDKAFDGNEFTRWGGAPLTKSGWLQVDLGSDQKIGRAEIIEHYPRTEDFAIEYQVGNDWKEAYHGHEIDSGSLIQFPSVTARYMRLFILRAKDVPTIQEFKLWGPDTPLSASSAKQDSGALAP